MGLQTLTDTLKPHITLFECFWKLNYDVLVFVCFFYSILCHIIYSWKFFFDVSFCSKLWTAFVEELKFIFLDLNHCFVVIGHLKQSEMPLVITIVTSEKA